MSITKHIMLLCGLLMLTGCYDSREWDGEPYYGNKSYWEDRPHWGDEFYGPPRDDWKTEAEEP